MKDRTEMKILTARHFLFHMGMACVAGTVVAITSRLLEWSNGLTFAAAAVAATVVSMISLRESLFAPAQRPDRRRRG
jgi:putative flippase GtrA